MRRELQRSTNRVFLWMLLAQWPLAIALAMLFDPAHAPPLAVAGAALTGIPAAFIVLRPDAASTRYTVALGQLMWSVMFLWGSGERLAPYCHVFGSLILLSYYRDWRLIVSGALVFVIARVVMLSAAGDLDMLRLIERAGWMTFALVVLLIGVVRSSRDMMAVATNQARILRTNHMVERLVHERTAELEEASERYRALVENSEVITFELDFAERRILYVSPQVSKVLEQPVDDPAALFDVVHRDDLQHVYAVFDKLASGERSWSEPFDCRLVTASGRTVHVRTFLDARAGSRCVRGITIDITRQHQLEHELQHAQKLESVGRLAAGLAHEINTPIQFVGDSVDFMSQSIEDVMSVLAKQQALCGAVLAGMPLEELEPLARAAEEEGDVADLAYLSSELPVAAKRALDGIERVASIVRSMKVFAHPDKAEMAAVDLNQAVEATLTIARNEYRYVANVETDFGELPPVTCYAGEINQVMLNVIVNAAHAIGDIHAQTGCRGKITVKTRAFTEYVEIAIQDTGGGIPAEVRERIFDPFFTTKAVGKGTGQGLPLARSVVVERHQGQLTFDTIVGVGTTFYIRLPIQTAHTSEGSARAA